MGSAPAGASNAEAAVNWLFANASDHPADGDAVFEPHDPYFVCATRDEAALFSRGEARARPIDASELGGGRAAADDAAGGAGAALAMAAAADGADDDGGALRRVLFSAAFQARAEDTPPPG